MKNLADAALRRVAPVPILGRYAQVARTRMRDRRWTRSAAAHPFVHSLREGQQVVDLGANTGQFAIAALRTGAAVDSWEPNPIAFARLQKLCLRHAQLTVHNAAVGAQSGTAELLVPDPDPSRSMYDSASGSIRSDKRGSSHSLGPVRVEGIREVLESIGFAHLIKMDVEGAEFDIVPALLPLQERFGRVLVELHGNKLESDGAKDDELRMLVREAGLSERFDLSWT